MKEQLNQQDRPKVSAESEKQVSANEGQETASNEPISEVLDPSEQAETGSNLEPETVQILDSEEGLRCSEEGFEAISEAVFESLTEAEAETFPEVPQETVDLAKMLQASAEQETAVKSLNLVDQAIETAKKAYYPIIAVGIPTLEEIDEQIKKYRIILGPQPDGTLSVLVRISEEYIAGVEEAARTDGRTVDQWCTDRFQEYLDAYYTPIKGR